jgi:hypothetical protein
MHENSDHMRRTGVLLLAFAAANSAADEFKRLFAAQIKSVLMSHVMT